MNNSDTNIKFIIAQKISSPYVGEECLQIMIPKSLDKFTAIVNSDGPTLGYGIKHNELINSYFNDSRKEEFPYSNIPSHVEKFLGNKMEYFNQLIEYNRVYLQIVDNHIFEKYAVKDKNEAFIVSEVLEPQNENSYRKYMTEEDLLKYLSTANVGIYTTYGQVIDKDLNQENILKNQILNRELILVAKEKDEITSIKKVYIRLFKKDTFEVITIATYNPKEYTLDQVKVIANTKLIPTKGVSIPKRLNKAIEKEEIVKAKKLVLSKKRKHK